MKNTRSAVLIFAGLVAATLVLAIWGPGLLRREKAPSDSMPAAAGGQKVAAKGVVESLEDVELGSRVAGVVKSIVVEEGNKVERGQLLVELDDNKIRARVEQARAQVREARTGLQRLESGYRSEDVSTAAATVRRMETIYRQARDEFDRQERLYRKEAVTQVSRNRAEEQMNVAAENLASARFNLEKLQKGEREENVEAARASLARYRAELNYTLALLKDYTIKSPIDGMVAVRLKEPGESVDVGTPLLKVFNPDKLRIRAELEETDAGKVVVGQVAEVTTDAFPGRIFKGRVDQVFPDVRKKSQKTFDPMASFDIRTQALYITLDDFSGLKNGMTVTVSFLK